jgi:hypothetical protein
MARALRSYLRREGVAKLREEFKVDVKVHPEYKNLFQFKYNQIESPMGAKVVQECRGIILDADNDWAPVCYTYDKFFNHNEPLAAGIDWSTAQVYEKLDGCFLYDTPIVCFDGSTVKIGDIVSGKVNNPILAGVNESGEIVPSLVTGVKDNGTKDVWLDVSVKGLHPRHCVGGLKHSKVRTTPNHQWFVGGRYIPASEIEIGDKVVCYRESPTPEVTKFIEDSLLGDGSLVANGKGYKFQESHKKEHEEYVRYIEKILGKTAIKTRQMISGYGTEMLQVTSKSYETLNSLREKWYPNGQKAVPEDLSFMDDASVAKWYMDDGSLAHSEKQIDRACFSTNGFSQEGVERLCLKLSEMYGVNAVSYESKGWNIRINAGKNNEIDEFWKRISPFIVPCMRYKLPEEFREEFFTLRLPEVFEKLVCFDGEVESIEEVEVNKKNFPHGRKGFDIETETHNFFAKGVLVHNSLMQMYFYDGKWHVATSGTPNADCAVNMNNITFKDLFWQTWDELGYDMPDCSGSVCYAFELMTPYNRVVVKHAESKLVLHGRRNLKYGYEEPPYHHNWNMVQRYSMSDLGEIVRSLDNIDPYSQEGYIVCDHGFNRIKIKAPQYVAVHRVVGSMSQRSILDIVRIGEAEEFLAHFPEWQSLFDDISERYHRLAAETEQVWHDYCGVKGQKAFAMAVKKHPLSGALFQLRAGKIQSIKEYMARMNIRSLERLLGMKD